MSTITLTGTAGIITYTSTINLEIISTPSKTWGGKNSYKELSFRINDLQHSQITKLSSLKMRLVSNNGIYIDTTFNKENGEYIELLKNKNLRNENEEFKIIRNNEEACGEVELEFKYVWLEKEHTYNITLGSLAYKDFSISDKINDKDFKGFNYNDPYKDYLCHYRILRNNGSAESCPNFFFDNQGITLKFFIPLNEKEEYSIPIEKEKIEIELYNYDEVNQKNTYSIEVKEKNYIYDSSAHKLNFTINIDKLFIFDNFYENGIFPISLKYHFQEMAQPPLFTYFYVSEVTWEADSSYQSPYCTINLFNDEAKVYNYIGEFKFCREIEFDVFNNEWYYDEINPLKYFFYGIGFYYNFEKCIAKNQQYNNVPYWFYLFNEKSQQSLNNIFKEIEYSFYKRENDCGIEVGMTKKKTNDLFVSVAPEVTIFKKYGTFLKGIQVTFSGSLNQDIENYPYSDLFFEEWNENISCYESQEVVFWTKNLGAVEKRSLLKEKNQTIEDSFIKRDYGSLYVIIDDVALFNDVSAVKYGNQRQFKGDWNKSIIYSNYEISLIERDALTNEKINEIIVHREFSTSDNNFSLLENDGTLVLSKIGVIPDLKKIYSFNFSITLQNFKNSKTLTDENSRWIPFYYNFFTEKVFKNYDPKWIKRTYSQANSQEKGIYRINEEAQIVRTPQSLNLQEGEEYYECLDIYGNKSPYYDESKKEFYDNYTQIPIGYKIKINDFFKKKGKDDILNYNKLLDYISGGYRKNLINFPFFGTGMVYYWYDGIENNEWKHILYSGFNELEEPSTIIYTEDLDYVYPEKTEYYDKIESEIEITSFLSSPLSEIKITNVPSLSTLKLACFINQTDFNQNLEWEYPALGKIPTVAYRKNRIGINTTIVNNLEDVIIAMKQIDENKSRLLHFYDYNGNLTLAIDIQTGNIYTNGSIKTLEESPML